MDRKPNHDLRGRPYADSLKVRAEKAIGIVCRITSARRTTRLSIPAGDLLHAEPCGDEDMYLCDVLRDQADALSSAHAERDAAVAAEREACAQHLEGLAVGAARLAVERDDPQQWEIEEPERWRDIGQKFRGVAAQIRARSTTQEGRPA